MSQNRARLKEHYLDEFNLLRTTIQMAIAVIEGERRRLLEKHDPSINLLGSDERPAGRGLDENYYQNKDLREYTHLKRLQALNGLMGNLKQCKNESINCIKSIKSNYKLEENNLSAAKNNLDVIWKATRKTMEGAVADKDINKYPLVIKICRWALNVLTFPYSIYNHFKTGKGTVSAVGKTKEAVKLAEKIIMETDEKIRNQATTSRRPK